MIGIELVGTCFSSSHSLSNPRFSFSLPLSAAAFTKNSAEKQERVGNTPLSPSHAGDKGDLFTRLRASKNTSRAKLDCAQSPKGDLWLNQKSNHALHYGQRHVDVAVLPRPSSPRKGKGEGKAAASEPSKENTNATTINGAQIANASIARAADRLFGYANFSNENGTTEENSTFKWYKRTLYQPQNSVAREVEL